MGVNHQSVIMIRHRSKDRALLHFDGANASQSFPDAYLNPFTAQGAPALSTAEQKFGTASASISSANVRILCTDMEPNRAAWTMECWVNWNPLFTDGFVRGLYHMTDAVGYGYVMTAWRTGTALTFRESLSSNGTTWNLMNQVDTAAGTIAQDAWYHVASTYDASAGAYYSYFGGALVRTLASASQINACTLIGQGADGLVNVSGTEGFIDEFRLSNVCRYPGGTPFTPSTSAFGA